MISLITLSGTLKELEKVIITVESPFKIYVNFSAPIHSSPDKLYMGVAVNLDSVLKRDKVSSFSWPGSIT